MVYKSITLIISLFLTIFYTKAQITTTEISRNEEPFQKVKVYDGKSDFKIQERDIDYKQYIGLKVFFPSSYTYGFFKGTSEYTVKGPIYFTIRDVIFGVESKKVLENIRMRTQEEKEVGPPLLVLKAEDTENTHYYLIDQHNLNDFLLVSYFLKQKELHEKKEYLLVSAGGSFQDEATGKLIEYNDGLFGGKWNCEVSMLKSTGLDFRRHDGVVPELQTMHYIFRNTMGHVITQTARSSYELKNIPEDIFVKKLNENSYYRNEIKFMLVEDYKAEFERIKAEDKIANTKEKLISSKRVMDEKQSLQNLKEKYGIETVNLITQGKVKIGMNTEVCAIAWAGLLGIVSRTHDSSGTYETWKHALYGTKLHFKNKKLYKIVD